MADDPRALNDEGVRALAANDAARAAELFARATAADPRGVPLWINLAKARRLLGDDMGERAALEGALSVDQRDFTAIVRLAELHERRAEHIDALRRWSEVLAMAPHVGEATPELRALYARAQTAVQAQTQRTRAAVDAELGARIGSAEPTIRRRFEACIGRATGARRIFVNECAGLYYPFLPADEFFDRAQFPWMAALEARTPAIRAEFEALVRDDHPGFAPYVEQLPGTPPNKWTPLDGKRDWTALYLWKYGEPQHAALERCPETVAALAAFERCEIAGRGPTVFFSILRPHSRIPQHTGVTNTRTIVHLPLIVPADCGFRVGGETREWREGKAFAFDDTIEHEAWNDSDAPRAVLIFDVWNPHLAAEERALIADFFRIADETGAPRPVDV